MTDAAERRLRAPREQASRSNAIHVDWITGAQLRDELPGRLGLTHLPGKHGRSQRYPGLVYQRDLDADLRELHGVGVRYLLLLVDDGELRRWGDPAIERRAADAGIRLVRHPMADGAAPGSPEEMDGLLASLDLARRTGDAAVACMGGVGRTGTLAACALVTAGRSAADAIREVRRLRHPDAVETEAQRRFVETYARWRAGNARES
jgi:protein-tyrosine phosphatase